MGMPAVARFLGHGAGSAAVEFALAMPALILLLAGTIEIGAVLFANMALENAVREAARFGITGRSIPGQTREDTVRTVIAQLTFGMVRPQDLTVETRIYPLFSGVRRPEPFVDLPPLNGRYDVEEPFTDVNGNGRWDADQGRQGVGGTGEIVFYSASFQWTWLTGVLRPIAGDGLRLSASLVVRNEP